MLDAAAVTFTLAAAQYPIDALDDWDTYAAKIGNWVGAAAEAGARLAVFPEYGAMELASLDMARAADLAGSLAEVSSLLPAVDELHVDLARRHGMYILAASAPCLREDGRYVNRARFFGPSGRMSWQDKLVMTRFEREQWGVAAGDRLRLFDTELGRIGVTICYDSEFPLLSRALVETGADLLLVPSCTDSLHGYWRVRIGAQARALESQCLVVQAPTVGSAPWSPAVDVNRGAAGVYAPPDRGLPDSGVLAIGELDQAQWVFCEADLAVAADLRRDGNVLNARDWADQPGSLPLPAPEIVELY